MRCLALSQAWQDSGGEAVLVAAMSLGGLSDRLVAEGLTVHRLTATPGSELDGRATAALARDVDASWVAVDGYHFTGEYQRLLKDTGTRVAVLDDYGHAEHYWADVIVNQNLHARESLYAKREPDARMLLGTRYVLLRREFLKWRGWERTHPEVARKILVTLGGSDPDNVTAKALAAVAQLPPRGFEASVVVGSSNPNLSALEAAMSTAPDHTRLHSQIKDMSEEMAWADVAVAAGGSTSWELAFMGLPVLSITLARNQADLAETLAEHGVARNLGWHLKISEAGLTAALSDLMHDRAARSAMAVHGRRLVDGYGAGRVVRVLLESSA